MLPLAGDIGLRVNLLSVVLSAFSILILYLSIVRIIRAWRGPEKNLTDQALVYSAGVVGALALAFSHSVWFNAVEAEVYAVSMFFTALVYYLALVWLDHTDTSLGNRLLLFIFYLIGLSSGVHLLNVLALISITYIVAFQKRPATFGNFILTGVIGSLVILAIYPGIIQGLPALINMTSVWVVLVLLAAMVGGAVYCLKHDKRVTAFALLSALLVILGYSTFYLIKIRSGLNPFLDENDPETWGKLLSYLNREQYGSESLMLTIFDRKAPFWEYQIKKMYLRYLGWQFLDFPRFLAIPFLLGIIGAVHHFYREAKGAFVVLSLFLMTGLAVVLYLNQDDPQPRERDYAYVGSFYAFAIWIGIGVVGLYDMLKDWLKNISPLTIALPLAGLCIAAVPLNMVLRNYHSHDRSGNYVAWDYSYNLLQTCEPNAVLYTNGDNDTFPLWYLQVVEGIRTDVRVANLSLLNTGWFIQQIRDKEPKVPMTPKITNNYIDNVIESREITGLLDRRWQQKRRVSIDGPTVGSPPLVWDVPATLSYPVGQGGKTEYFLRVQDYMILNTIAAARWQMPLYFAVTVPEGNLLGLHDMRTASKNFLAMEGLAFKLWPDPAPLNDLDRMADNLFNRYRYRNLDNPHINYDDNILKLLGNYRQALLQLAFHYFSEAGEDRAKPDPDADLPLQDRIDKFHELSPRVKSLTSLDFMNKILPEDIIPINYDVISLQIGRLYAQLGRPDQMKRRLDEFVNRGALTVQNAYEYGAYYLTEANAPDMARQMFNMALDSNASLDNCQRVAYTWLQFSPDTSYPNEIFRRYLEQNQDRASRLRVASQALTLGLEELAFSIYEPLWAADPGDRAAVYGLIECYQRKGNVERALTLVRDWLGAYPGDSLMIGRRDELQKLGKQPLGALPAR
ncbi:MAG: DUF2723 domain-containing protein [Calditrichota bacterium]